jgi:hypothetical protein
MANTSISGLTAAGALTGTEILPLVQAATTKRSTLADLATFARDSSGALTFGATTATSVALGRLTVDVTTVGKDVLGVATSTLAAVGNAITVTSPVMNLSNTSGGGLTLTSTPTITAGATAGTRVTLVNVGANPVVLQGEATLPNTKLKLGAATRSIGTYGHLSLIFYNGFWVEESFAATGA